MDKIQLESGVLTMPPVSDNVQHMDKSHRMAISIYVVSIQTLKLLVMEY